ncbi:rho GTPase-activating protein 11A-like isoform X2 [Leucoraja erinacea]|uniref:rho GTPase-activating protein 11A-like isoform X2 n=1 Tax=Leucoraja erinaceus TaxID=7782 RepID=UPI0024552BA7|nr:rho GTPase-activating protein 11A-like isoform X2 [Leucoraja erinacea]
MKVDRNILRLAVVQHLRDNGIKVKQWNRINCNRGPPGRDKKITHNGVFGTPLHALPLCTLLGHASLPQFLVDACSYLEKHIDTEGLFRKSGSVSRLRVLKEKVDQGEKCLTLAPPCDVAGLIKQFFRELPEPVLPVELHEAFFRAQQLQNNEKISTTLLLSCLLPEKTIDILHYFLNFLQNVSLRSKDNKMDASNLAVVFAPNLFHSGDGSEKVTSLAEKRLHLQAATVHTLIDNFDGIGCFPEFILEKVPAMLGDIAFTTPLENLEDGDGSRVAECKRHRRRSVGDIVSGALSKFKSNRTPSATHPDSSETSSGTPIIKTPTWKRKLLVDSSQSLGLSNKKRRSRRHNIALELLPSGFLSQNCTPSVAIKKNDGTPQVSLESLQGSLLLSNGSGTVQSIASANRRKSKRLENKKVERLESGKTCCFSPKLNRKEMVRKSLRLKFSIGKSKDTNTISSAIPAPKGSENIGWRLANQSDGYSHNWFSVEDLPINQDRRHKDLKGWKHRSKSEENLLTPISNKDAHRMSWNGASPAVSQVTCNHVEMESTLESYLNSRSSQSEPALVIGKPPTVPGDLQNQNITQKKSSDSLNQTGETVLKIKKAFSDSGNGLCALSGSQRSSAKNNLCRSNLLTQQTSSTSTPQKDDRPLEVISNQKWSSSKLPSQPAANIIPENVAINPCPTDMSITPCMYNNLNCSSSLDQQEKNGVAVLQNKSLPVLSLAEAPNLDTKCVTVLSIPVLSFLKSNHKQKEQNENSIPVEILTVPTSSDVDDDQHHFDVHRSVFSTNELSKRKDISTSADTTPVSEFPSRMPILERKISAEAMPETECGHHFKVVEHINRFNSLSLNDQTPKHKAVLSPLKFRRTPVHQSIRRMNALSSGSDKLVPSRTRSYKIAVGSPKVKPLNYESGLSFDTDTFTVKQNLTLKQSKQRNDARHLSTERFCKARLPIHSKHSGAFKENNLGSQHKNSDQRGNQSVFEDWTNRKISRIHLVDCELPKHNVLTEGSDATPEKSFSNVVLHKALGKEKNKYKGSPKCPISTTKLTIKAIDL